MPCLSNGTLTVCTPTWEEVRQPVIRCFNCKQPRRCLATFQEWYGWTITCLTCGDRWQDGEILPRPFARGWRLGA